MYQLVGHPPKHREKMLKLLWFFIFSIWLGTAYWIYFCDVIMGVKL
jgi:hypothetical protein